MWSFKHFWAWYWMTQHNTLHIEDVHLAMASTVSGSQGCSNHSEKTVWNTPVKISNSVIQPLAWIFTLLSHLLVEVKMIQLNYDYLGVNKLQCYFKNPNICHILFKFSDNCLHLFWETYSLTNYKGLSNES